MGTINNLVKVIRTKKPINLSDLELPTKTIMIEAFEKPAKKQPKVSVRDKDTAVNKNKAGFTKDNSLYVPSKVIDETKPYNSLDVKSGKKPKTLNHQWSERVTRKRSKKVRDERSRKSTHDKFYGAVSGIIVVKQGAKSTKSIISHYSRSNKKYSILFKERVPMKRTGGGHRSNTFGITKGLKSGKTIIKPISGGKNRKQEFCQEERAHRRRLERSIAKPKHAAMSISTQQFPPKTIHMTKQHKQKPVIRKIKEPRIKPSVPQKQYVQRKGPTPAVLSNRSAEILENHKKFVSSPKLINRIQQDITTEYTLTVLPEFLQIIENTLEKINNIDKYPNKEAVITLINELKNNNILCELLVLISMTITNDDILYYISEKIYELKDYTSLMTRIIKLQMLYKDILKSNEKKN